MRILGKLSCVACMLATAASAGTFTSVVAYGDSLSDNGNLFAATGIPGAPYYQGRRSNGPVAVEQLATSLGVPLVDFAWIGATTGIGNYGDGGSTTTTGFASLPGMQTEYQTTKNSLAPLLANGLFVVWGGPNDFLAPSPLDTTPNQIIARGVADIVGIVGGLQSQGAQHILVAGIPDLGLTPTFRDQQATYSALSDAFNAALVANLPTGVLYYDTAARLRQIVANPGAFGFTNATDACFTGTSLCANPNQYVFFDSFHPTAAASAIVAAGFEATAVPEPGTWSLLIVGAALLGRRYSKTIFSV